MIAPHASRGLKVDCALLAASHERHRPARVEILTEQKAEQAERSVELPASSPTRVGEAETVAGGAELPGVAKKDWLRVEPAAVRAAFGQWLAALEGVVVARS